MPMWNAVDAARACRACAAGLALVILPVAVAEAEYGPRTKIGKNYQQWSNTTSPDGIDPGNCSSISHCYILFQKAPQQKPLIVQHVTCAVRVTTGEIYLAFIRTWKGQTGVVIRTTHLVPVPTGGGYWVVNSPVIHLLKPGERAAVLFQKTGNPINWGTPPCSISGKLQ